MAELTGSVPPFYRDVYAALCPSQSEVISQQLFTALLSKSGLERSVLSKIWSLIECKGGINRTNLYKGLALVAFAQSGKNISEKLFENFAGQELPKPNLGDLESIKKLFYLSKRSPTSLSITYQQCCDLDTIQVSLIPEKKGIFLKHVEYDVFSKKHNSTVRRRYNDFVAFHELLQQIYPYRMIPKLPPKNMMKSSDRQFIEGRRKSLRRFLNIVARHPAMHDSQALQFFLTYNGEVVNKIKEQFRAMPDEFITNPDAQMAKELVGNDTAAEFASSKEQLRFVTAHVKQLCEMTGRIADRTKGNAVDMLGFGKELIAIGNDTSVSSSWATGGNNVLSELKSSLRSLSVEFSTIAEKFALQGTREEEGVVDQLYFLYDLLQAYHDLVERHEKGVLRDHHSALKKYGMMKTKRMAATISNMEQNGVDRMESRIQAQENEIITRENRNCFSLHCIHLETQLVYLNMQILSEVVATLVATQIKGHREMAKLWEDLAPRVSSLVPQDSNGSSKSPPSSPR